MKEGVGVRRGLVSWPVLEYPPRDNSDEASSLEERGGGGFLSCNTLDTFVRRFGTPTAVTFDATRSQFGAA